MSPSGGFTKRCSWTGCHDSGTVTERVYGLRIHFMAVLVLGLTSFSDATDEQSLLKFKQNVQDPNDVLSSWNASLISRLPVCNWVGVTCDNQTLRVTNLNLSSSQLAGSISPAIGSLAFLESLDLTNNAFSGSVPAEIGNCSNLKSVNLSSNLLTGEVPVTVGSLRSLRSFSVSRNQLNNTIPPALGNCSELVDLDLSYNNLVGSLPDSLGNCTKLGSMKLSYNSFTGPIPSSFGSLGSLKNLDLSHNYLQGPIPPGLGNCSELTDFDLSYNKLNSSIPDSLGDCTKLVSLDVTANDLYGWIPSSFGKLGSLKTLHLSRNVLKATIPPALGNCSELQSLDLSSNNLNSSIPPSLGNCTKLILLNLTENHLTGPIPSSFGNLLQLQGLLISSNSLTGGFPIELFQLREKLTAVDLSENRLTGSLPDKFDQFKVLSTLDLSSNNLTGDMPTTLGQSQALLSLSLAHNRFTGALPSSIGSLQKAFQISFNLSYNLMSGGIDVLGSLSSTVAIDISRNKFSGGIESLTHCEYLSILNLADNLFSGQIEGLLPLRLLFLSISENNLRGSVDGFGTNFTSASFLPGNDGLCGLILNRPCPATPSAAPTGSAGPTGGEGFNQAGARRRTILYAGSAVLVFSMLVIFASWLDGARVRATRYLNDAVICYGRGFQIVRITVKDLLTATGGYHERHVIGHGGTSTVYKGLLPFYPFIVAVKKFQDNEEGRQRLLKEAGIMNIVRHRNIVGTVGVASIPRSINALVLEYVANGTLNQHLHGSEVCELSWEVRLDIAIDLATAVSYLHEDSGQHLAVIHGDLKPSNVFLDSDFSAKVGDFGLSKLLIDVDSLQRDDRRWEGTFGYSPPEHGEGWISTAGDVYSFGIVILEMATRRRPASLAFEDLGGSFINWVRAAFPDRLNETVDPSLKLADDFRHKKDAIDLFFRVGLLCTSNNPRERPTMREALEMLKTLTTNLAASVLTVPLPSIEELIIESPDTSFQHAKTWGWINHDYILHTVDSALYGDSWISLFQLDMRDSRTLRGMGFDAAAIIKIRKQCEERRAMREREAKMSRRRTFWRAFFRRKTMQRINPR